MFIEHEITPTIEECRTRITALRTAMTIANTYLSHRESADRAGGCMAECPKCRAEAVLEAGREPFI